MPAFEFHWFDPHILGNGTDLEKYQQVTRWAAEARGVNPGVFDSLTEWLLEAGQWEDEELAATGTFSWAAS